MAGQQVLEALGDLDGRHPHREPRPGPLFLLADASEQPGDGRGDEAEGGGRVRGAQHRLRLAWPSIQSR